ncbi:MAG: hypothetical protein R3E95_08245 [Thiolinea sp.]
MYKHLIIVLTLFYSGNCIASDQLPPIANPEYVSEPTKTAIAQLEQRQNGEKLEGYYFIRIFDGLWPVPLRFTIQADADNNFNQYILTGKDPGKDTSSVVVFGLNKDIMDEPITIKKVDQDRKGSFERKKEMHAFPEGYQEISINGIHGYYGKLKRPLIIGQSDDYYLIELWNEKDYIQFSNVPDGLWQAMLKTHFYCKESKTCLPDQ